MTEPSFGRRSKPSTNVNELPDAPHLKPVQQFDRLRKIFSGLVFAAVAAVVVLAASYVGQNLNWVLSIADPKRLEHTPVTPTTPRLFPYWNASLLDKAAVGNIVRTLMDFHELCGNVNARAHWGSYYERLELTADIQTDVALYRSDIYDHFATRTDLTKRFKSDRAKFCSREYWEAFYDARVLISLYGEALKKPINPILSGGLVTTAAPEASIDPRPNEPDYNINGKCAEKWRDSFSMQEYCVKNEEEARGWSRRVSIDDDVRKTCAKKWDESWTMYKYCATNEQKSKDRLQN